MLGQSQQVKDKVRRVWESSWLLDACLFLIGELLEGEPLLNNQCYGDILCSNCSAIEEHPKAWMALLSGQDWIQTVKKGLLKIGGMFRNPPPQKKIEH